METSISEINELANDIAVLRLSLDAAEKQVEELIATLPQLKELNEKIETMKFQRDQKQASLLEVMSKNHLKTWATDEATFSRASRLTVKPDKFWLQNLTKRIKSGEQTPEGFVVTTKEYISIKSKK